jgi:hypothetical protein
MKRPGCVYDRVRQFAATPVYELCFADDRLASKSHRELTPPDRDGSAQRAGPSTDVDLTARTSAATPRRMACLLSWGNRANPPSRASRSTDHTVGARCSLSSRRQSF